MRERTNGSRAAELRALRTTLESFSMNAMKLAIGSLCLALSVCHAQSMRPRVVAGSTDPVVYQDQDPKAVCSTKAAPTMPPVAAMKQIPGEVVASARIRDGTLEAITIVSGPEVFHDAVIAALKAYKCPGASDGIVITQQFTFNWAPTMTASPVAPASSASR